MAKTKSIADSIKAATAEAEAHKQSTIDALTGLIDKAKKEMTEAQNRANTVDVAENADEYLAAVNDMAVAKAKADTLTAKLAEVKAVPALSMDKYTAMKDQANTALTAAAKKEIPGVIAAIRNIMPVIEESNAQFRDVSQALEAAARAAGDTLHTQFVDTSPLYSGYYGLDIAVSNLEAEINE